MTCSISGDCIAKHGFLEKNKFNLTEIYKPNEDISSIIKTNYQAQW
jgi:hypothetical protein